MAEESANREALTSPQITVEPTFWEKYKKVILIGLGVIVVIIVAYILWARGQANASQATPTGTVVGSTGEGAPTPPSGNTGSPSSTGGSTAGIMSAIQAQSANFQTALAGQQKQTQQALAAQQSSTQTALQQEQAAMQQEQASVAQQQQQQASVFQSALTSEQTSLQQAMQSADTQLQSHIANLSSQLQSAQARSASNPIPTEGGSTGVTQQTSASASQVARSVIAPAQAPTQVTQVPTAPAMQAPVTSGGVIPLSAQQVANIQQVQGNTPLTSWQKAWLESGGTSGVPAAPGG